MTSMWGEGGEKLSTKESLFTVKLELKDHYTNAQIWAELVVKIDKSEKQK